MIEKVKQVPVDNNNLEDLKELIKKCQDNGYQLFHGLDDIKDDNHIIAIVIDTEAKEVFQSGITGMACWCSRFGHPMNTKEVIDNFDEIIIKINKDIYDAFLAKIRYDNSRNKR